MKIIGFFLISLMIPVFGMERGLRQRSYSSKGESYRPATRPAASDSLPIPKRASYTEHANLPAAATTSSEASREPDAVSPKHEWSNAAGRHGLSLTDAQDNEALNLKLAQKRYIQDAKDALTQGSLKNFVSAASSVTDEEEKALLIKGALMMAGEDRLLVAELIKLICSLKNEQAKKELYSLFQKHGSAKENTP